MKSEPPGDQVLGARSAGEDHPSVESTRSRILDIALELFTVQGYEKTSLRQIAEELGYSKAAIYYHFKSKDEILLALHYRLHDFGHSALESIETSSDTVASWTTFVDQFIDLMLEHRNLFTLHERNRAALERLHDERHGASHDDLEDHFRRALGDTSVDLDTRVRMAASFGAIFGCLVLVGDAFHDVPAEDLRQSLRWAVRDLMRQPE